MKPDPKLNGKYIEGGGGAKLFVETAGDPAHPPILFIHGFSQCRLSWDRQFDSDLAGEFHLVRLDIRGHGLSDKPKEAAAYQDGKNWADDVNAVIQALGLERPVLSGWSYGGFIMCDYVRHHGQEGIAGINFVNSATELGYEEAMAMLGPELLALADGLFSTDAAESNAALQAMLELVTFGDMDPHTFYLMLGFNSAVPPYVREGLFSRELNNVEILQGLTVPVLIHQGDDDRLVLKTEAEHIAGHVSHATKAYYPECGHAPFFEVPGRFNQDLAAFVRQCRG